ncbi:MAG: Dolichyl-phosphate-mannose-protein mannosyltransferase [Acidobacteria bacterium OLB17]|nr:MAG: Dolichyl-phosphate-mannose-protein mannosyltransferase [Acidobacteria bacterium OLB17]MCZ2390452.1 glycosyltransferase family 39 protein [Acidobacteriota bacterium]
MHETEKIEGIPERRKPDVLWLCASAAITVAAFLFRFYDLTLKPLHHDEGVNGFFLTTLFRTGVYKYDPANYHGPTLYYISLFFSKIFGLNTFAVRASVAVFGVLTVVLVFYLKRYLGRIGSLSAALFLALSPGMTYISRYFIHETFFTFCTLAIVVAVVLFIEKERAGIGAKFWMLLLLTACFLPPGLNIATYFAGSSVVALWAFRVAVVIVEAVLILLVLKSLLEWQSGRPIYLLLAAASAALLFATKETAFISIGTMLIATVAARIWQRMRTPEPDRSAWFGLGFLHFAVISGAVVFYGYSLSALKWVHTYYLGEASVKEPFAFYMLCVLSAAVLAAWAMFLFACRAQKLYAFPEPELSYKGFVIALGSGADRLLLISASGVAFVFVLAVFFSSYFSYPEGLSRAVEAYMLWTKTGTKDHTQNGVLAYLKWGMKVESPLLLLSGLGGAIAFFRPKHRFATFSAFWAFGMLAAYTIIPYKTPWLALSFYLPMCLIAGYGINEIVSSRFVAAKLAGVLTLALAVTLLAYQAYDLNFVRYDDEEMGYVYAHTKRGMLDLVKEIEHFAAKSPAGRDSTIEIVSPDYWPLTWYLNDYPHANFYGSLVDANTSEMIVAKKNDQDTQVVEKYSAHYKFVGVYPLRPGVDLMLLVRRDLADPQDQDLYKIYEYESK